MVDMEGISGIVRSSQVLSEGAHYQEARHYMTWDVNACVEGCFHGGATRVLVRDAHANGFNLLWSELDGRAELVQGRSRERMPGLEDFDGLILLGYHAMAGTPQAILEHTMSSRHWQNFWLNGENTGEVGIDAGIAGDHGVPTIMVSGDDKVCEEAGRILPGCILVAVKQGWDVEGGLLLSREKAHLAISEGAARAVRACREIQPYRVAAPVRMRLELVSRGLVPVHRPHVTVLDGRTFEVVGSDVESALNALSD
jgi:D-amino peptidase